MALILRGISLARSADPPHEPAEWLIRAAATIAFNEQDALGPLTAMLRRIGLALPGSGDRIGRPRRTAAAALRRRFPMLQVRPVGDNAVHVLFPGGDFVCVPEMDTPVLIGMLTLLEHDEAIILPGLSTDQFLLALAALDGLALLACPELELTEISPIQLVRQREELFAFVRRIRHDNDTAQSYEQLISLFLTEDARGSLAGLSPSLWGAAASVAIASWVARSGQSRSGRPVNLERLHDVTGQEPEAMGDEYRLRFACGELRFTAEGDLAVGRGSVIDAYGRLVSLPLVSNAAALEWLAWAMAARDVFSAASGTPPWLVLYTWRSLVVPWFVIVPETARIVGLLRDLAHGLHGDRQVAKEQARLVLRRRPTVAGPPVTELRDQEGRGRSPTTELNPTTSQGRGIQCTTVDQ